MSADRKIDRVHDCDVLAAIHVQAHIVDTTEQRQERHHPREYNGMTEFVIRSTRVVLPDGVSPAAIQCREGRIRRVGAYDERLHGFAVLRDAGDLVIMPGLVDTHVHVNEPGRTEWEGFATASAAAAAGGITTIVDMPLNSIPPTVDVPSLRAKIAAAEGRLAVGVAFLGGAVPGNAEELGPLHRAGVVGVKCFLSPSGVDEFPPLGPAELATAMRAVAAVDGLLIAHAEDPAVLDGAPAPSGRHYADFVSSRPPAAEVRAVELLLAETRRTGCRTHVVHVSSAGTLPLLRAAKDEGLPGPAEACPPYLALRQEEVA